MVGAAVWKPRVPNDKLHRVTDNRLAEADRKVLHGVCWWSKLARYMGITGIKSFRIVVLLQLNHLHKQRFLFQKDGFVVFVYEE